ncbi:MAG: shikimate kinase [Taibaiella sp.]|nr:shikimate kinase [Taibaiella sp.]
MSMIFLVGMPGVGKTYWGRVLANKYGLAFADLDEEIEKAECRTIQDIFLNDGEDYFRQKERELLEIIAARGGNVVVACGGGTPTYERNMAFMKQHGCVVFLDAEMAALAERVKNDVVTRPLFRGNDTEETLQRLYDARIPYFSQAHYRVQADETIIANFEKIIELCTERH